MIKNFIYLDTSKLYSLSSQVFEGITEYIVSESSVDSEKSTSSSKKESLGSGKIIGDILKQNNKESEKKFFHDYSYTLFEKKLLDENKVLDLTSKESEIDLNSLDKSFIKVKAKIVFNDIHSILKTLTNFNKIGKSLIHVTQYNEILKVKEELKNIKSKNQKNEINQKINLENLAKESGFAMDQDFIDSLGYLLEYGFQDQLEVQMILDKHIISSNLKRECLRENEELLIRKYSRYSEMEFTILGIITQSSNSFDLDKNILEDYDCIKKAVMSFVTHLTNMETQFTGRLPNEIIIDPIALYTEL